MKVKSSTMVLAAPAASVRKKETFEYQIYIRSNRYSDRDPTALPETYNKFII